MLRSFLFVIFALSACSDRPPIGPVETGSRPIGPTPPLLTAEVLAALATSAPITSPSLSAEAAALRARADRLRAR